MLNDGLSHEQRSLLLVFYTIPVFAIVFGLNDTLCYEIENKNKRKSI